MSDYKTELQSNNVDLQSVLSAVQGLEKPGANFESVTLEIGSGKGFTVTYVSTDLTVRTINVSPYDSISDVLKNSVCFAHNDDAGGSVSFSLTKNNTYNNFLFRVDGRSPSCAFVTDYDCNIAMYK